MALSTESQVRLHVLFPSGAAEEIVSILNSGGLLSSSPPFGSAYTQTYATATRTHSDLTSVTVTDSSGGSSSATLAAETLTNTLTITGLTATADHSLADITFNSTWSQGQADTINKNFKEVVTELALQKTLDTAIRNALASLATLANALRVDLTNLKGVVNSVIDDLQSGGVLS